MSDQEFESSLGESDFIKPHHEAVRTAAREIVGEGGAALDAVRSLSDWVHGYIEPRMIAETLSGPEVLSLKTGKCSEYSTLFASLARAVGIPARIVLGERLVGAQWMGHMWNEAYVGKWIPVDASANEVGESFALLKFIHSDTVDGTQTLRWKLTESLEIKILDFARRASPLAEKHRTGVENNVYTNVDFACRVASPRTDWKIEDESSPGHVTVRFRIPMDDEIQVHFVAFALPRGTAPRIITDARLQRFRSSAEKFELTRDEPCDVNGNTGHTTRFVYVAKETDRRYRTTEVVWACNNFGYLLNLISPEAKHDEVLPEFEKLLASFESLSTE